jgi:hypothetical protein
LITLADLRRGRIDHALQMGIPQPRKGVWAAPAQRTDGNRDAPTAIPEGAHFRLDPRLDVRQLDLPPITRMIAKAAQTYGIVVNNVAGVVAMEGQDPTPTGKDPYTPLYDGMVPGSVLQQFPWHRLQVLKMKLRTAKK